MTEGERLRHETAAAREQAEALLRSLHEAKAKSEKNLAELGQADAFKRVTGRSSYDNAIHSAQRMVEALARASTEFDRDVHELELHVLRKPLSRAC